MFPLSAKKTGQKGASRQEFHAIAFRPIPPPKNIKMAVYSFNYQFK
jgi:hypothetical protein